MWNLSHDFSKIADNNKKIYICTIMHACRKKTEHQVMNGYRNTQEKSQKFEGCSLLTIESNLAFPLVLEDQLLKG
jgi:hypothetical protein